MSNYILINTENVSVAETQNLEDQLENECWDWKKIESGNEKYEVRSTLQTLRGVMEDLVEKSLDEKGLTSGECQRRNILKSLREIGMKINSIESTDF